MAESPTAWWCPECGRRWQVTPWMLREYGPPRRHSPRTPDVALVIEHELTCPGMPVVAAKEPSPHPRPRVHASKEVAEHLNNPNVVVYEPNEGDDHAT